MLKYIIGVLFIGTLNGDMTNKFTRLPSNNGITKNNRKAATQHLNPCKGKTPQNEGKLICKLTLPELAMQK